MVRGDDTRATILQIVQQRRGVHKSELCRLAGKGWGTVGHHLLNLEREGLVQTETHGRLLWAFDPTVPYADRSVMVAARHGPAQRLLEFLGLREQATIRGLSDELELSKKVIWIHLSNLQRAGAVERTGHPPVYRIRSGARK